MDYNQPTGGNPGDPYVGKNVAAGIQGSRVRPHAVEYPQREIVQAISDAGLTPSNGDLTQLSQAIRTAFRPLAGPSARLTASLTSAGNSLTFTADAVGVAAALGGAGATLGNYNKTLNVGTTGAGGMDTGSAPISGFVSVYAIYNPTTQTASILGTTACQTTLYTGGNMPAGYTQSALIAIWPTDGSRHLVAGDQIDRRFYAQAAVVVTNGVSATVSTAISLAAGVPAAAREAYILAGATETSGVTGNSAAFYGPSSTTATQVFLDCSALNQQNSENFWVPLPVPQTIYYHVGQATMRTGASVVGYSL